MMLLHEAALGLLLPALLAGDATAQETGGDRNRFNVLLICVDDLRPELGCYGATYAPTPNIDRLASSATVFTRHFVQVPTCGPSRAALLTGRSPLRSGLTSSNEGLYRGPTALRREPTDAAQTLPELFRRSGYRTVLVGKVSHTPDGRVYAYDGSGDGRAELPGAWDELATPFGPWKRGWGTFFAYADGRHREDGEGHRDLMEFVVERDEDLPDGLNARVAVEKLAELAQRDEPFFLGLGFYKPHLPHVATQADWEAVAALDVPPPEHAGKPASAYWHRSGEYYRYDFPFPKHRPLADEDALRARRAYLACVRYTDRQVGKVLDALDELELAERTVVVLWGDHGWHLGESQIWGKHSPFERALRSPLIVRAPGMEPGVSDALVESLDVYPTLVDLCRPGFTRTEHPLDGLSLVPLLGASGGDVREAAVSCFGAVVSVRNATHRLIARRTDDGFSDVELYALADGPDPIHDVADDEPELVERLLALLSAPR
jgi:arylsulfatase A-like enzyme